MKERNLAVLSTDLCLQQSRESKNRAMHQQSSQINVINDYQSLPIDANHNQSRATVNAVKNSWQTKSKLPKIMLNSDHLETVTQDAWVVS